MALKVARGSRPTPGSQDRRSSQPPPLTRGGASRSGSNGSAGRQAMVRAQGVMEDKYTALEQNCKLGINVSLAVAHGAHGGGVIIPSMFKAPHFVEASVDNVPIKPSNPDPLQDRVVAVTQVADDSRDLVTLVLQNKVLHQIEAISDDNGPLDISNSAGGLSMASLCLSVPSTSGNEQQVLPEGKTYQLLQGFSLIDNVKHVQNSQIEYHDLTVAKLSTADADSLTSAGTLKATCNPQQGKEDYHVAGEGGENFYSLLDQSRDSDDADSSTSTNKETGNSSSAPTSMLRRTAFKCHERRGVGLGSEMT
ncbi:hypothetical protein NDU88_005728 [Pleurodeles waltl]|uniref:Uncharacterized protein n=1 Tax=Pleurodeles waltl TaxID=8319 RepID=A0AAV7RLV2_PLEWA|nr:hypothetical protein NDU88_005728 [Pleurodeles waltl]